MRYRDLEIRWKLMNLLLVAVGFAMGVAAIAVIIYEYRTFRPRALGMLDMQSKYLSEILIPPLQFDDPGTATKYLATLRHRADISAAALFDSEGNEFATYSRDVSGRRRIPRTPPDPGPEFSPRKLTLAGKILDQGAPVGYLWIESDIPPLPARLPQYGIMFAVVLLSLLAVAGMLSAGLKHGITLPLIALVEGVARVTRNKDYRIRVWPHGDDEIGRLTREFNRMLEAVEQRDQSLMQANARSELILNTTIDGVMLEDADGRILDANPASCRLLGYTRDEMLGLEWAEMEVGRNPEEMAALLGGILDGRRSRFDSRLRTKHGEILDVEVSATVVPQESGRILTALKDVTERKRAEDALDENRRLLQSVIDASSAVIYVKDPGGRYLLINRQFERLFHVDKGMILGKSDYDLFSREAADLFAANDRRALAAGRAVEFEETARGVEGPRDYISIKAPLFDNSGKPYAVCGISTDITDRKRIEGQLRQSQKMEAIGSLAGGIAHDFNNLLTAINGYSHLALQGMEASHPLRDFLLEILKAGERAAGLTRQLLAYSRKQEMAPAPVNLNTIVSDMERMLRRLISENVELVAILAPDIGMVMADRSQVEQIILNLALNARDAMPQGGTLTLETRRKMLDASYVETHLEASPGPHVMLAVNDTGIGMTPEVQARIFEPFFTTKEVGKGTGLGLSVVYGIVKQSGGSISVYSEPGMGTTFRIYFPEITQAQEAPEAAEQPVETYRGTGTLLLVEDDESVRHFTRRILESLGYFVLEAADGLQALEVLKSHAGSVRLVITDVVMPKMGGMALAERIRAAPPAPPILFVSGYSEYGGGHNGIVSQGERFIQKPFNPQDLGKMVQDILSGNAVPENRR
jgi:two-component system, cell cycle sensor histidine kinase and response regulator CckA